METKICNTCGEEKPITEFNFRDKRKGTHRAQCKECIHKRKNELYQTRYKERYKEKLKENKNKHRELIRQKIKELKSCGCVICGEMEMCCLDFHHLYGKDYTISSNADVTLNTLLKEVEKCIVLCANCHRKLHAGKISLTSVRLDGGATNSIYINIYNMTVLFKKLNEKAVMPTRTENSGAGFNLTAVNVSTKVNSRGQVVIIYHSGIGIGVQEDYEAVLRPANDISTRTIRMCNPQRVLSGNIDDEIVAEFMTTTDVVPQVYNPGEVFAQLVLNKKESVDWAEIEMEASAGEGDQSPLEKEGEPTNSEDTEAPSGGEENVPEQAE